MSEYVLCYSGAPAAWVVKPEDMPTVTFTRAELDLRIAAVERSIKTWKGDPGYCRLLNLDLFALKLVRAYVQD